MQNDSIRVNDKVIIAVSKINNIYILYREYQDNF